VATLPALRRSFARAGRPCFLRRATGIDARVEHGPATGPRPGRAPWPGGKDAFLGAAVSLGLAAGAAGTEIDQPSLLLNETGYHGLVQVTPARTTCGSSMAGARSSISSIQAGARASSMRITCWCLSRAAGASAACPPR
jgi:hypothetical protein